MMFPATSETTENPSGLITFTSSTPGLGVRPGVVVADSFGSPVAGRAPVVKGCGGVVRQLPSRNWIRAWRRYFVAAIMPATRIDTVPPPDGAFTGAVERP